MSHLPHFRPSVAVFAPGRYSFIELPIYSHPHPRPTALHWIIVKKCLFLSLKVIRFLLSLNHFPFPIDGKSPLAARESDAAVVASGPFAGGLCPAQSFFQGYAVVGDHAPKDNRSMGQGMAQGGNQETTYNELCLGFWLVALNNSCVFVQIVWKSDEI